MLGGAFAWGASSIQQMEKLFPGARRAEEGTHSCSGEWRWSRLVSVDK